MMRPHKKQKQPTPTAAAAAAAGAAAAAASPQLEEKGDGSSEGGSRGSRDRPISPGRPPPVGPIASPQFHIDSDSGSSDGSGSNGSAWSAGSSSASSLLDEVEEGFERQLDALARFDGLGGDDGDGDAPPVLVTPRTTDTEEAEVEAEEEGLVLLLARLPHGDKRRRWILNSLHLHAAQAAARRRRLLCLGKRA